MKRKNYLNGSIFQFYVPEIKKYAFCRYYNFRHISEFHGLLAQVYDLFKDTDENEIKELSACDALFGFRSMHKWPNLRKGSGWKLLGTLLDGDCEKIPDFKGVQSLETSVEDESKIGPWYAIHDLTIRSQYKDYSKVAHLERMILTTHSLGLVWRTGMEYCRANGLNLLDYYDLNDEGVKNMYYQMINVPLYKTIPRNIRGEALI